MKSLFTILCCSCGLAVCAQSSRLVSRFEVSNIIDSFAERIMIPEVRQYNVSEIFSSNLNICSGDCGVVPVRLILLEAKRLDPQSVNVVWETADETNNKGFFIQRSLNIVSGFSDVGFVAANENHSGIHHYEFVDENGHESISYYRLRQIDLDNSFLYSKIVSVQGYPLIESISLYPNPASQLINAHVYLKKSGKIRICLFDNKGRKIFEQQENCFKGSNIKTIDISHLPASEYLITATNREGSPMKAWFIKN